jgi:hypothetical protein
MTTIIQTNFSRPWNLTGQLKYSESLQEEVVGEILAADEEE